MRLFLPLRAAGLDFFICILLNYTVYEYKLYIQEITKNILSRYNIFDKEGRP